MKGGRFMGGEALTAKNGSTILNCGIFLVKEDLTLDNAALITEEGGTTLLGYSIFSDDFRNATTTTISDGCISGQSQLPSLTWAWLDNISDYQLSIKSNGRLVNRGTTVIHQKVSGADKITSEKGSLYYNK